MKSLFVILFCIASQLIFTFEVPFSNSKVKTEENHFTELVRVSPDDKKAEELITDVWIWYNEKFLTVYWEAEIDESFTKGLVKLDDQWPEGDFLRFQLVTQLSDYYAYQFYAFPQGSRMDGTRQKNMNTDQNWDSSYQYKNEFKDNKWHCTMKIPFKDLRFNGEAPRDWKFVITRYQKETESYYSNPYLLTSMRKDYFRKANDMTLTEEIHKGLNLKIRPSAITLYDIDNDDVNLDEKNLGLDIEFNPNNSLNAKASFRPDFSEVPIDEAQDIYNEKYEPEFRENRYFFTEDLDVFGVQQDLLYTRYIVKPEYAFKVTGNTKAVTYGFLISEDEDKEYLLFEDEEKATHKKTSYKFNIAAINLKKDRYNTQFTFLKRKNALEDNTVFFINPSFDITNRWNIYGNLTLSDFDEKIYSDHSSYEKNETNGYSYVLGASRHAEVFNMEMSYSYTSDDFNIITGRTFEDDNQNFHFNTWINKSRFKAPMTNMNLSSWASYGIYNNGDFKYANFGVNNWVKFYHKFSFWINANYNVEDFYGENFATPNMNFGAESEFFKAFTAKLGYEISNSLNYYLAETYLKFKHEIEFHGELNQYVSYWVEAKNIVWEDLPESNYYDDNYQLANANITITKSSKMQFSNGLRFSNYERAREIDENVFDSYKYRYSIFSNMNWEYRPDSKIIVGYSLSGNKINSSLINSVHSIYLKLNYMIG